MTPAEFKSMCAALPTETLTVLRRAFETKIDHDQRRLDVAINAYLLICDELRKRAKKKRGA